MQADAYFLQTPNEPLQRRALDLGTPAAHEAIVEVIACGLCHTDLGFFDGSVPPRHALPLVLGHEVVGRVVEAGDALDNLVGATVIVPAVLPCGDCEFCRRGRANACPSQKMPGNDVHGGFATHLLVPGAPLVRVPDDYRADALDGLSVVADAVSTAYRAIARAEVVEGDVAFVVGSGGVGSFATQIAHSMGAKVVALDVRSDRLELALAHGADEVIDVSDLSARDVKKRAHGLAKEFGASSLRFKIFECSGTTAGQNVAYGLLARAATLVFVGYTPEKVQVRLSNLMAFDATVYGTWGCPPEDYGAVLDLLSREQITLEPFIERAPMSQIDALLDDMAHHRLSRRMVLDPRA